MTNIYMHVLYMYICYTSLLNSNRIVCSCTKGLLIREILVSIVFYVLYIDECHYVYSTDRFVCFV